ncbi:MAG: protein kinase [Polyangiaceae bacterium]
MALKFLRADTQGTLGEVAQIASEREAQAAAQLRGEHRSGLRRRHVGGREPFIVMEYLQGRISGSPGAAGAVAIADAVAYVLSACEAIAEAHASGIVHRDLKPANLFLAKRPDGRRQLKVLDFGISKLVSEVSETSASLDLTGTRGTLGSPLYMSPEQLESPRDVDFKADIWALGIILYELLVGKTPFHGNTLAIVHARILVGKYESPTSVRSELPPDIDEIVARCLQHSAEARFPTVAHLAIALEGFAQERMHEIVASTGRIIAASKLATPDLNVAPGSNYPPPSTHAEYHQALASAPTHAATGDRSTGSDYGSGNLGVRISRPDEVGEVGASGAAPATSAPPAIPDGMPATIANGGGKSPWVPMYSPVGQTLGGSAVSGSREGRSKLGPTLLALGGVAVVGIAAAVWLMTRPVTAPSEPLAVPTQDELSSPAHPNPAEASADHAGSVEPEVSPSSAVSIPSAVPSAGPPRVAPVKPRPALPPKPASKPQAKPTATATDDPESMLKYRK